ncbi:MAG: DUF4190 domain-containing protein [Candidatus Omnitrophica bacterium]|nr:DUF4190 domain-containing protein [Candidatus Omnitrophota bacterium]
MTETQKKTLGMAVASLILGCLFIIPFLNLLTGLVAITLGVIALIKISNNQDTLRGKGLAITGISLGALGILMIPVLGLLAAIAIPNFLRARINAMDAAAESSVRMLSSAIESYQASNGSYPLYEEELFSAEPPYLPDSFRNKVRMGYVFTVELDGDDYRISAVPEDCGATGTKNIIFQNGELIQRKCKPSYK